MSTLTAIDICNGISGQIPVVRCWNQNDGSFVSGSQPAELCSKSLLYGGKRRDILKIGTEDPTLKCSLLSSQPVGTSLEAIPFGCKGQGTMNTRSKSILICLSALNARCGAEQTQTITRESSTITVAPVDGKSDLSPTIDDGGSGFPPGGDDDVGGGGGSGGGNWYGGDGGGGNWSGGFFFFGFLAFIGLLHDREKEGPYDD